MALDQFNKLEIACRDALNYPTNGIRTNLFRHILRAYKGRLAERSTDLFEESPEFPIDFLDAYNGEQIRAWDCSTAADLGPRLWVNREEPHLRHIFIQADTSIAPLDCSKDVFLLLLTFHQVMPQFLELVFSFGRQPAPPTDFHYTAFHHENFLGKQVAKDHAITRLGRSGRQLRQCYNLWGVEISDADGSWSFRQTAVYHSFDIENGKTLWINIKANDLMLQRIKDVETTPGRRKSGVHLDSGASLSSALMIHLVIFAWCSENWRGFLATLEQEIRGILTKVKNAPIDEVEKALLVDLNALLDSAPASPSSPRRVSTLPTSRSVSRQSTGMGPKRVLSAYSTTSQVSQTLPSVPQGQPLTLSQPTQAISVSPNKFGVLNEFSVKSLQRLGGIGSKLQEAALVMNLNGRVINSIKEHYETLFEGDDIPNSLKIGCKDSFALFREQIEGCLGSLEMERSRIATLTEMLEDGKRLFDTILQFRNMEVNKSFAVNAQETAARMEVMTTEMHQSTLRMEQLTGDMGRIAEKTERETASMHIITLVTLVFLPGTFVATLFGSGLFQWDQNHPELPFPMWKQKYFNLFAEICFPLMFGVIAIWFMFYLWTKRKEKQVKNDEEMQRVKDQEKAGLDSS